ncbi:patr class I histocompatibility antigen, alpha chain E-like [Engraulis encrasicolus]|uniref:patr class I histocompatibility antigen, alpha chain E-like n=1 Tax=Engraulis encrasicolus TaxID=184585 RepID=UPI002FCFB2EF
MSMITGLHSLEFQKTVYRPPGGSEPRFFQTILLDGEVVSQCQSPELREQLQQQWADLAFSSSEMENRDQACQAQYYEMIQCLQEIQQVLNNTTAVLQRRHGCSFNDTTLFPLEQWGVNGDDFLTFDPQTQTWLPQSKMAAPTALRWNRHLLRNQIRNHVYSHFNQDGCRATHSSLHRKRLAWGQEVTSSPHAIDVQVFAKPIPDSSESSLQCHVTGSDLSGVTIQLTKDGVPLYRGVELIGPRTNGDGTNQMRVQALISMTDTEGYQCEVYREPGHHSSATLGKCSHMACVNAANALMCPNTGCPSCGREDRHHCN